MRRARLRGQSLVFSLIFLSVVIVSLLLLYNQGMLVSRRIQIENAADASAYSIAKLAARHQNFVAYTNRAMVANEVSIGQIAGLVSWAERYKNIPQWLNAFPPYQTPIGPTPITVAQVLRALFIPYEVLGNIASPPAKVMAKKYPVGVSFANTMLAAFQSMFGVATAAAQMEVSNKIVQLHSLPGESDDKKPYIPKIGYFFLAQNIVLSYWGDNFSAENLINQTHSAATGNDEISNPEQLVADFLGDEVGLAAESMYNTNDPDALDDDDTKGEFERFAAFVNEDRDVFSAGRHFPAMTPPLTINLPPLPLAVITVQLSVSISAGFKSDGGSAYRFVDAPATAAGEALSWSAVDFTSLGVEIGFRVEICDIFGLFGCTDFGGTIPIALPVSGASYQYVSDMAEAMRLQPQWGSHVQSLLGMPDIYGTAFSDFFHVVTASFGNVMQIYSGLPTMTNPAYSGAPMFMSLGESFRESGTGYEFAIAVAKRGEGVGTSDNEAGLDINGDTFGLDTRSVADDDVLLEFMWEDEKPLMTVASAETYFARPDGQDETASLFSPFWDARLRETSPIIIMIANNDIDPNSLIPDLSAGGAARFIVEWTLDKAKETAIDKIEDYVDKKVDPPLDIPARNLAGDVADQVLSAGTDQLFEEIDIENW